MRATSSERPNHELARFNFAIVLAGLATIVHLVWMTISFLSFRQRLDAATMVIADWDSSILMMHIRIALALLLSMVSLWSRRVIGLFLSVLALAWIGGEYIGWYIWSVRIKSNADIENFPLSVRQALNLYGASAWNIVVLVLVIMVLVWTTVCLIRIAKSQQQTPPL